MRVKLELKQDGKGPEFPLYFRISDRQKRSIKRTPYKVAFEQWDPVNQIVINHREAAKINKKLATTIQALKENVFETNNTSFGSEKKYLFNEIVKEFIAHKRYTKKNTHDRLHCVLVHIQDFQPVKFIDEIDLKYLNKYYLYLKETRKLKPVTIKLDMIFLRSIIQFAIKILEVLPYEKNPFNKFTIPEVKRSKPKFLTKEQVNKLQDAVDRGLLRTNKNSPVHSCAVWFLFSCYTGLRISDLEQFSERKIINDTIILTMQKTGEQVAIPITNEARKIINILPGVLPFYRGWQVRIIGKIGEFLGFDEKLHFHVARHTFATNCARNLIGIEITQKLLGHSTSKTTEIYYHLENQTVKNELLSKFKF